MHSFAFRMLVVIQLHSLIWGWTAGLTIGAGGRCLDSCLSSDASSLIGSAVITPYSYLNRLCTDAMEELFVPQVRTLTFQHLDTTRGPRWAVTV
jgi:hypothetical protein